MRGADGIRTRRTCPSLGAIGDGRTSDRSTPLPDALLLAHVLLHELGYRRVFHLVYRESMGLKQPMAAYVVGDLKRSLVEPSDFYFHSQSFMWVFPFSSHSYSYTAGVFRRRANFEDAFWKYKAPRQLVTLPRPECDPRP